MNQVDDQHSTDNLIIDERGSVSLLPRLPENEPQMLSPTLVAAIRLSSVDNFSFGSVALLSPKNGLGGVANSSTRNLNSSSIKFNSGNTVGDTLNF
jgi:hypothetical protein